MSKVSYKYRVGKVINSKNICEINNVATLELTIKELGLFKFKKYKVYWDCSCGRIFGQGQKVKFWTYENNILDIREW